MARQPRPVRRPHRLRRDSRSRPLLRPGPFPAARRRDPFGPLFEDFMAGYAEAAPLAGDHRQRIRRAGAILWAYPTRPRPAPPSPSPPPTGPTTAPVIPLRTHLARPRPPSP